MNKKENENKRYNMVYSEILTSRIITIQKEKGFKSRAESITYLLNIALDILETNKEK